MNDQPTTPGPENPNPATRCGGRRPSSCSPDDAVLGLLFQPFWWAGLAMAVVGVFIGMWSPLCFIGGILVGGAVAKCAMRANRENNAISQPHEN